MNQPINQPIQPVQASYTPVYLARSIPPYSISQEKEVEGQFQKGIVSSTEKAAQEVPELIAKNDLYNAIEPKRREITAALEKQAGFAPAGDAEAQKAVDAQQPKFTSDDDDKSAASAKDAIEAKHKEAAASLSRRLQGHQNALNTKQITETHFDALVVQERQAAIARGLPHEVVDRAAEEQITSRNPANKLMYDYMNDASKLEAARSAGKNRVQSWLLSHMGELGKYGMDIYAKHSAGVYSDDKAVLLAAPILQQDFDMKRKESMLKLAEGERAYRQNLFEDLASGTVRNKIYTNIGGVDIDVGGGKKVNAHEFVSNFTKYSETMSAQELNEAAFRIAAAGDSGQAEAIQQLSQRVPEFPGIYRRPSTIGSSPSAMDSMGSSNVDNAIKRGRIYLDSILGSLTKETPHLAEHTAKANEAFMAEAEKFALGDQATAIAATFHKLGLQPDLQGILKAFGGTADKPGEMSQTYKNLGLWLSDHAPTRTNPTWTPSRAADDAHDHHLDYPSFMKKMNDTLFALMVSRDPKLVLPTARKMYADENEDWWFKFGKEGTLDDTTKKEIGAGDMTALETAFNKHVLENLKKMDAPTFYKAVDRLTETFNRMYADDTQHLNDMIHNTNSTISWDSEHKQLILNPGVAPDYASGDPAGQLAQQKMLEDAQRYIDRMNRQTRVVREAGEVEGRGDKFTETLVLQTLTSPPGGLDIALDKETRMRIIAAMFYGTHPPKTEDEGK